MLPMFGFVYFKKIGMLYLKIKKTKQVFCSYTVCLFAL